MRTVAATRQTLTKLCVGCDEDKPVNEFGLSSRHLDGRKPRCKPCRAEWDSQWTKTLNLHAARARQWQYKRECIDAYGGVCACCGEDRLYFLSIDHVAGDGGAERKGNGNRGGAAFYNQLRKEGYPQNGKYQVLCFNCNLAKGSKLECPCQNPKSYHLAPPMRGQGTLF